MVNSALFLDLVSSGKIQILGEMHSKVNIDSGLPNNTSQAIVDRFLSTG